MMQHIIDVSDVLAPLCPSVRQSVGWLVSRSVGLPTIAPSIGQFVNQQSMGLKGHFCTVSWRKSSKWQKNNNNNNNNKKQQKQQQQTKKQHQRATTTTTKTPTTTTTSTTLAITTTTTTLAILWLEAGKPRSLSYFLLFLLLFLLLLLFFAT